MRQLLDDIAQLTGPYRRSGNGWVLRCPAHDDKQPSLSISVGTGETILVKCHAGCETEDVIAAAGWQMSELFLPEPEPLRVPAIPRHRPATPTTSEYLYRDERGQVLFRVVMTRHPNGDKETRQHAFMPDGDDATDPRSGGWAATLGTARRVLYRLPQVARAAKAGAPIYVVEGEKCVEALEGLGVVATTNPGGALKWIDSYAESLLEATRVVILPDNDDNGAAHARDVHGKLTAAGIDTVIVEIPGLPEKGDIADWIAAGGTRQEFLDLVEEAVRALRAPSTAQSLFADYNEETPPAIRDEAWTPLLREAVDLFDGVSEADPVGIAMHLLVSFGAMVGPNPYVMWGTTRIQAKEYALIIGDSGAGRKGQAWGACKALIKQVDPDFFTQHRLTTGLSSGEGMIARLHRAPAKDGEEAVEIDPRLLAVNPEFASILRMADRKGNTLSPTLRQAWDDETLDILTRSDPLVADEHHVCHIGHITPKELRALLTEVDVANGFANRYLFTWVHRGELIPIPAAIDEPRFRRVTATIRAALQDARAQGQILLTPESWQRWREIYEAVHARKRVGIPKELSIRASAHVMRLALLIALFESSPTVDVTHLNAALAFWDHSEASFTRLFGSRIGDPHAERLLAAAQKAGPAGLDGTQRHQLFSGNLKRDEVNRAVETLLRHGLAFIQIEKPTGGRGRPREVLVAREYTSHPL